jgi:hypothetical protein
MGRAGVTQPVGRLGGLGLALTSRPKSLAFQTLLSVSPGGLTSQALPCAVPVVPLSTEPSEEVLGSIIVCLHV